MAQATLLRELRAAALVPAFALMACRQSSAPPLDTASSEAAPPSHAGVNDAAPTPQDPCAQVPAHEVELGLAAGPLVGDMRPFDVAVFGARVYEQLFMIDGFGSSFDPVRCNVARPTPSALRIDCLDGTQKKIADVSHSNGQLDITVDVDGERVRRSVAVGPCRRLSFETPERLSQVEIVPSRRCGAVGAASPVVDAYFRRGARNPTTGLRPVFLDIARLGIRHWIGETTSPDRCESAVTIHGWVYVTCKDGDLALITKLAALPGEIAVVNADDTVTRVAIPCGTTIRFHPLECAPPDCEGGGAPASRRRQP